MHHRLDFGLVLLALLCLESLEVLRLALQLGRHCVQLTLLVHQVLLVPLLGLQQLSLCLLDFALHVSLHALLLGYLGPQANHLALLLTLQLFDGLCPVLVPLVYLLLEQLGVVGGDLGEPALQLPHLDLLVLDRLELVLHVLELFLHLGALQLGCPQLLRQLTHTARVSTGLLLAHGLLGLERRLGCPQRVGGIWCFVEELIEL
mmetsp:Transcript_10511/g.25478  ORF Transcript_10511/g.25478 Transcript_10511/m.25478 type:complete len:204 (-) Transcript_10511:381-992(-)